MSNLILSAYQCTVDYAYQVEHEIESVVGAIVNKELFPELNQNERFVAILNNGLAEEISIDVGRYDTDGSVPEKLVKIRDFLSAFVKEKGYAHSVQIGGNPAIMAIRAHLLRYGSEKTDLPQAYYVGLYPSTPSTE